MASDNLNLSLTSEELNALNRETVAHVVSAKSEIKLTTSEERKSWWIYFYHTIIFIFIFVMLWHLTTRMIFIYLEYKGMIDWIDTYVVKYRSQVPADQQLYYYNFSSGYTIAFYYVYPNYPTNPFLNNAFPASVVYSYYTPQYNTAFTAEPKNLQEMFVFASMGSYCSQKPDQGPGIGCMRAPDPNEIICGTYGSPIGNQQGFTQCSALCIKATSMSLQEWTMSCMGSSFGGMAAGGPVGLLVALPMQIGINVMSDQEQTNFANSEQYCQMPS